TTHASSAISRNTRATGGSGRWRCRRLFGHHGGKRRKEMFPPQRDRMQTAFDFTPGLTVQFKSLRQVLAAAVYGSRASLNGVASDLDLSPSELQRMLNRGIADERKLDTDDVEKIIASTGDLRPVHWMVEKFLQDPERMR